jgi:hypothetical protein
MVKGKNKSEMKHVDGLKVYSLLLTYKFILHIQTEYYSEGEIDGQYNQNILNDKCLKCTGQSHLLQMH